MGGRSVPWVGEVYHGWERCTMVGMEGVPWCVWRVYTMVGMEGVHHGGYAGYTPGWV